MKAILCLALIATCAFAIDTQVKQTAFIQTTEVRKNEMTSLILDLAQIHMATEGPIEDLRQALQDLVDETQQALASENSNFAAASENHDREVDSWNALISSANADIASTQSLLEEILRPRKASLEVTIANLEQAIADNIATTAKESQERADAHDVWVHKDAEYATAIDACREALTLLNQLRNQEVSLAQVRSAQNSMKKLQTKVQQLKNNKIATFLNVLASIAQNFSNQEVVVRVISLVEGLLQNCVDGRQELQDAEDHAANVWANERLPQLEGELASSQASLVANQGSLADTETEISDRESFLETREQDLKTAQEGLDNENANWATAVSTHEEASARLNRELEGAIQANDIISSASFTKYLNRQINQ